MASRAWVWSYKKYSHGQARGMVLALPVLRAGWASSSSAWTCCGQRLSQSKCIRAQLSIRLLRPHPSQGGVAEEGKAGLFLPLISLWTYLGQCWCETGFSLASCFRFRLWRWAHQEWWNLTREIYWPCRFWRCSWRSVKLQRGYSDEGGRGAQISELLREISALMAATLHKRIWGKAGDATGTTCMCRSFISSAAPRQLRSSPCMCSCQELWQCYQ